MFGLALGALVAALTDAAARRRAPGVAPGAADPPPPKIAFLFLTRGALPHDHLWARFFQDQDPALYAVHVHAPPDFTFDATTTSSPDALRLFRRAVIPNPVASTAWGTASVVLAEKRLLARALLDPAAERFVLLSESCVPIRPFPRVRAVLLDTDRSFVESSLDRHQRWPGAHDPRAAAEIPRATWRKGSQWFAMTRPHAAVVVDDERLFRAFERYCAANDPTATATATTRAASSDGFCAPDEHYVPTVLTSAGLERQLENRGVTYANWWPSTRWHPKRYAVQEARDAVETILRKDRAESLFDGADETCGWFRDGAPRECYLFARKFTPRAGVRIGTFAAALLGY